MLHFPNCKINLGLRIREKRSDGYHNLETVFYPIHKLRDALELIPDPQSGSFHMEVSGSGDVPENNTVKKAWQLMKEQFPNLPGVKFYLQKAIPSGAGLGGGSSDGAFALKLMNEAFRLGLDESALLAVAVAIGSDAPFFILNQPAAGSLRGERLVPVAAVLQSYHLVLINPGIHVSTPWAFSQTKPSLEGPLPAEIILQPIETWQDNLVNDFELPVSAAYPAIGNMISMLKDHGAIYAAMSGSGSTVYGIFKAEPFLPALPSEYFVFHQPVPQQW